MSVRVVQMHGEPGSGKSTLARAIAPHLGAVVLDKDVIKAALLRAGISEREAASGAYEVYFAQADDLVRLGHSVILDNPVFWPRVEQRWLGLTESASCPPLLIECLCPDRAELERRLATRDALESQPRAPLDLTRHPGSAPTAFQPRLTLNTICPLPHLAEQALSYIECAVSVAPTLTTNDQRLRPNR
jgi:predicted kinase